MKRGLAIWITALTLFFVGSAWAQEKGGGYDESMTEVILGADEEYNNGYYDANSEPNNQVVTEETSEFGDDYKYPAPLNHVYADDDAGNNGGVAPAAGNNQETQEPLNHVYVSDYAGSGSSAEDYEPIDKSNERKIQWSGADDWLYTRPEKPYRVWAEIGMGVLGSAVAAGLGVGIYHAYSDKSNRAAHIANSIASPIVWTGAVGGSVYLAGYLMKNVGDVWTPFVGSALGVGGVVLLSAIVAAYFPQMGSVVSNGKASAAELGGLYAYAFDAVFNVMMLCGGFILPLYAAIKWYETSDAKNFEKMTNNSYSFYPAIEVSSQRTTVGVGIRF